jgi:hypothetical protein
MKTNRYPQGKEEKGSKRWIQDIVNRCPSSLDSNIRKNGFLPEGMSISWKSPLVHDDYAEYRDEGFLEILDLSAHKEDLRQFWPKRGPQWDALGIQRDLRRYYLVEAKANIPELGSSCQAEDPNSIHLIEKSLVQALGIAPNLPWQQGFYQYANRLAHLYFLREIAKVDAVLVLVYFLNDRTHLPTSVEAWHGALTLQKKLMCISSRTLLKSACEVFVDTDEIK